MQPIPASVRPVWAALVVLLGGCATNEPLPAYKLYPGPELEAAAVATILAGKRVFDIRIDGLAFTSEDYDRVHVLPGTHSIEWYGAYRWDEVRAPKDSFSKKGCAEVDLGPGHTYSVRAGHPESAELSTKLWIEIVETGAVLFQSDVCLD